MGGRSTIEWTETTWNPITGCTKISAGCVHCYAARMAKRLAGRYGYPDADPFAVTIHPERFRLPLEWRKPRLIFVNSMSDLFHESIPFDIIRKLFSIMAQAAQHTFQILTKRAHRLAELAPHLEWPPNVWQGVTVESAHYKWRIDYLRLVPATVRFISFEPLIGPLGDLDLQDIHWVIVGGESGPGARPMDVSWARQVRDQCIQQGIPFFFKQHGGVYRTMHGRLLDGRTWDQMPAPAAYQAVP